MSTGSPQADVASDGGDHKSPMEEEKEKKEKRLREIRAQIEQIKKQIEETDGPQPRTSTGSRRAQIDHGNDSIGIPNDSRQPNNDLTKVDSFRSPQEARRRQRETIEKVTSFKNKLRDMSKSRETVDLSSLRSVPATGGNDTRHEMYDELSLNLVDEDTWLTHRFEAKDQEPTSDLEDHEEERSSRKQVKAIRLDMEVPRGDRHRHRDRSRSTSRSGHGSESHDSRRERHSSRDNHHRRSHRHGADERSHRRSSSDKDGHRRHRH